MCDLGRVHEDIIALASKAADLAFDNFGASGLDDHVIRSAIRQEVLNLGDIPEGIFLDAVAHARQFIESRIRGGEVQ